MSRRTLLIGLDGATFDILDPFMRGGVMPSLAKLAANGARAVLRSTVPALTPPAWMSLVTGRSPGAHGIFDFFRKNKPSGLHFGLLTSRDVACPTVWTMAHAAGLRSTVLNFPSTFPPSDIRGHIVPGGFMPWRQMRLGCHPEGLFDELKTLPRFNPRELALDMSEEAKAIEGCAEEEYEPWVDMHIRRERQWVDILRHLKDREPADFTAVLFDGVDKLQHLCWRFIDSRLSDRLRSPWEKRMREKCLDYFRLIDSLVGELAALFGEESNIVVVSDHGFQAQVRTFYVNAWLKRTGRLAWRTGEAPAGDGECALGLNQLARHVYQIDWERTTAFAPLPSGNGIHIVLADGERPSGVPVERYAQYRDDLVRELAQVTDPVSGAPVVTRMFGREEIFSGEHVTLAPDVTLELADGGLVSILDSEETIRQRPMPTGTHHPNGVFMAWGSDIAPGTVTPPLSILDIAPLLLYTLDLPIPATFEGRLAPEVLRRDALAKRPARRGDAGQATQPALVEATLDAQAEQEIVKRLQGLGYLE